MSRDKFKQPREIPRRAEAARKLVAYIAKRAHQTAAKPHFRSLLWNLIWELAGFSALTVAGFQLHSALGYSVAGLGCLVIANKFKPSS